MPTSRPHSAPDQAETIRPKKSLGQNFLIDAQAAARIVQAADLSPQDVVVEIGPGPGALTGLLAQAAGRVIAVEIDEQVIPALRRSLPDVPHVEIVQGDILQQDLSALTQNRPFKVVANLPYYITSAVLRHLLESPHRPTLIIVTVQREVAQRIVAQPGEMSLLAVSVQFYGTARIVGRIPPGAFRPMPKVHSAVVRIDTFDACPWGQVEQAAFFHTVRAGFGQKRKQLHNALAHGLSLSGDQVTLALNQAGIDGERRAETLSVAEWVALSRALGAC